MAAAPPSTAIARRHFADAASTFGAGPRALMRSYDALQRRRAQPAAATCGGRSELAAAGQPRGIFSQIQ